jgi:general secretion pathway protein N
MHRKRLITLGLMVGLAGLIALFPARVAYRWFAPAQFAASGISGTIWSGNASEATANGFYLRDLNWKFHPLQLFTGKIAYSVDSRFASGFMQGRLGIGFGGSVSATGLRATLPLEAIQSVPAIAGSRGMLTVDFSALKISDGLPVVADGSVELAGLMNPLLHRDPIGGFRAEFFSQDSGITASIEDTAAVIDLAGSLQLAADGSYQFLAQISALDSTPQSVREQLRFLGPPNDRGQHELRLEGKL